VPIWLERLSRLFVFQTTVGRQLTRSRLSWLQSSIFALPKGVPRIICVVKTDPVEASCTIRGMVKLSSPSSNFPNASPAAASRV
jgi:hypothetical protein